VFKPRRIHRQGHPVLSAGRLCLGIAGGDTCVSKAGSKCIFIAVVNNQRVTIRLGARWRTQAGLGNPLPALRPAISTGQDLTISVPGNDRHAA
jgi:hypothetical protein